MTPEEKFNQEIWWILQEIRKEQLFTSKGERVEFSLRKPPKYLRKTDDSLPSDETQRKLLHKLKEWKILDLKPGFSLDDDIFTPATTYFLTIHQSKFDEFYHLYESGGSYLESKNTTLEPKTSQSIIKPKSLELISREISKLDSGPNLVEFLTNCGVKRELIDYPNTKWRMIYSVLLTLASSQNEEDRKTLFKIIEGACHPLMYDGNKNLAKKTIDKFNSFLEYDNFSFDNNGVLWKGYEDDITGEMIWIDKNGNIFEPDEPDVPSIFLPKKMDELYVYWNELIKLTKFYFDNKDNQDDEINNIYFEIITNVENLLNGEGCGDYKEMYKRPFRNMIGCEFEIQKQGLTTDDLFVKLYDFLGEITEFSLPDKSNVEKIKKDNAALLSKIQNYIAQHSSKKELTQELSNQNSSTPKIEITAMPELRLKGLSELAKNKISDNKPKFPHKLPAGTKWEEMIIKFIDDENVYIQIKQFKEYVSYREMGFVGKGKNPNPSEAWVFLKVLAGQNDNELTVRDIKARDRYKKQKELLAKGLQSYFSLDYDPFYPYRSSIEKSGNSYKIKITLIPPPDKKDEANANKNNDDLEREIEEEYKRQTPEVYDEYQ